MILDSLSLFQFRNIERLDWEPHPRANLLIGANAQGKTNLLEAVFLLGTTKSLRRGAEASDLIQQGQREAMVRGRVHRDAGDLHRDLEVFLKAGEPKQVNLNAKRLTPLSKIFGILPVVLFVPEDLDLVKAGPSARRYYLDLEISQASAQYLADLQRYQRALKQRNAALRLVAEGRAKWDAVEAFEEALIGPGAEVLRFRAAALAELAPLAAGVQARIAGGDETLDLRYVSTLYGSAAEGLKELPAAEAADLEALKHRFRLRLRELMREERGRGSTLAGPHRDDIAVLINGSPARLFASQGQSRTTALALKLAELQFLAKRLGEHPVLLLDDVLSELDLQRQSQLLGLLDERVQTIVTSTHADGLAYKPGLTMRVERGVFERAS